jgi:hypothetical protein
MPPPIALFEYQIAADTFLAKFTNELRRAPVGGIEPIVFPDGRMFCWDRIEFGAAALRSDMQRTFVIKWRSSVIGPQSDTIDGNVFYVDQEAVVTFAPSDSLKAAQTDSAHQQIAFPVTLTFEFQLTVADDGQAVEEVTLHAIRGIPPSAPIDPDALKHKLHLDVSRPLDPGGEIGFASRFSNAGMTMDRTRSLVIMRLAGSTEDVQVDTWRAFFRGDVGNELRGHAWGLSMRRALIEQLLARIIDQAAPNYPGLSRYGGLPGEWTDSASGSMYNLEVLLRASTCGLEFGVPIRCTIAALEGYSVFGIKIGRPQLTGSDWECQALMYLGYPIIGALAAATGAVDVPTILAGFVYPPEFYHRLLDFFGAMVPSVHWRAPFQGIGPNEAEARTKQPGLEGVRGLDDHLQWCGSIATPQETFPALAIDVEPFVFHPPYEYFSCESDFGAVRSALRAAPTDWLRATLTIDVSAERAAHRLPLFVFEARKFSDPLGVFTVSRRDESAVTAFDVGFDLVDSSVRAQYFAAPYGCDILLSTSAGARLITLPPLPLPPADQIERLIDSGANVRDAFCHSRTIRDEIQWTFQGLDDPDPFRSPLRLARFRFFDVPSTSRFTLFDNVRSRLDRSRPDRQGQLILSAMTTASWGTIAIDEATDAVGNEIRVRDFELTIARLERLADIQLPSALCGLGAGRVDGRMTLLCTTEGGEHWFDLTVPRLPLPLVAARQRQKVEHMEGFAWLRSEIRPAERLDTKAPTTSDWFTWTADDRNVEVVDRRTRRIMRIAKEPHERPAIVGDLLLLTADGTLAGVTLRGAEAQESLGRIEIDGLRGIMPVNGVGRAQLVFAVTADGGHLLDLSSGFPPLVLASYSSPPWFVEWFSIGKLMFHAPGGSLTVGVHVVGPTRRVAASDGPRPIGSPSF